MISRQELEQLKEQQKEIEKDYRTILNGICKHKQKERNSKMNSDAKDAKNQEESKLSKKFAEMDKALEKTRRNYEALFCKLQPFINDSKLGVLEKKEEPEETTSPAINTLHHFIKTIKEMDKNCSNILDSLEL